MAWIIDIDHDGTGKPGTNSNAVGIGMPKNYQKDDLLYKFRMKDDDDNVLYEGMSNDNSSFSPLDHFGMPNAGCTSIEYFENGRWVPL